MGNPSNKALTQAPQSRYARREYIVLGRTRFSEMVAAG
jgi:hypothetical protein